MQLNTHFLLLFVQWAGSSRNILQKMFPIHLRSFTFFEAQNQTHKYVVLNLVQK